MYIRSILSVLIIARFVMDIASQSAIHNLGYNKGEIFPISIDHYGFPNVEISLKDTSYSIIWDTGNMIGLVLSEQIVMQYQLPLLDTLNLYDSEGNLIGFSYAHTADTVNLLGNTYINPEIATTKERYLGLVGPKYVKPSIFTIDYKNKLIGISYKTDMGLPEGVKLEMIRSSVFPYLIVVEGKLNGSPVLIEIDTGKSRSVIDSEMIPMFNLETGKNGVKLKDLYLEEIRVSFDNGKRKNFHGISESLPSPIRIGLGSDFLKDYLMTVDYHSSVVVLYPNH